MEINLYLRDKEIEAYIKPSNYEQLGTKKFAREIGRKENMQYDKDGDCYICHNGKKIVKSGVKTRKTSSGYLREETHYECKSCSGFTRFLCRGTENVFAEYVLYAMAHNLGWLHSRIQNDKLDLHLYELKEEEKNAA